MTLMYQLLVMNRKRRQQEDLLIELFRVSLANAPNLIDSLRSSLDEPIEETKKKLPEKALIEVILLNLLPFVDNLVLDQSDGVDLCIIFRVKAEVNGC